MGRRNRKNKQRSGQRDEQETQINGKPSGKMAIEEQGTTSGGERAMRFLLWLFYPLDLCFSAIFRIQLSLYTKIAGRMPLFLEGEVNSMKSAPRKTNDDLKNKNLELEKTNKQQGQKIEELENDMANRNRDIDTLNESNEKLTRNINEKLDNIKSLQQDFSKLESAKQSEKDEMTLKLNQERQTLARQEKSNEDLTKKNEKLQKQNEEQELKIKRLEKDINCRNMEICRLTELDKRNNTDIDMKSTTIKSLQQEVIKLNEAWATEKVELTDTISRLNKEKEALESEKEDALRRLSELVSVRLRDNNPDIVDLNDQCRPTKLAEMFSELYDNEWTSAYDILEDSFSEEQAIVFLLDTIMIAYSFCEEKVQEPWNLLTDWFLDESLPGYQQTAKWLKDSRKVTIKNKVFRVEKDFSRKISIMCGNETLRNLLSDTDVQAYTEKCIELCLLMAATDPPVVLECPGWSFYSNQEEKDNNIESEENVEIKHPEERSNNAPENDKVREVEHQAEGTSVNDNDTDDDSPKNKIPDDKVPEPNPIENDERNTTDDYNTSNENSDVEGIPVTGNDEANKSDEEDLNRSEEGLLQNLDKGTNDDGLGDELNNLILQKREEKPHEGATGDGNFDSDTEEIGVPSEDDASTSVAEKVHQPDEQSKPKSEAVVVTKTPPKERCLFNKDLFKEYTRRGEYLDYIVWPAMYLHKNGPLLSKGVAQGVKKQHKNPNEDAWTWRRLN